MEEITRVKYKTLVDALKSEECEKRTDYLHFESKMYQFERSGDIGQYLNEWQHNLKDKQKVQQYFNIHYDNETPILRTHLVYETLDSHILSVFSCNLENFGTLNLKGLDIETSKKGLAKLPYLHSKTHIEENENLEIKLKK